MDRDQDLDQVEEEFLAKFPEGTGRLAYELWNDMALLHLNWQNYRSLFGTSPERIDLLDWAASTFFGLPDGIVLHDVILSIARLTDPPKTGRHENACLASLIGLLEQEVEPFFGSRTTRPESVISHQDGEALIFALEAAKEHEECREREFETKYGRPFPRDRPS